jgi:hypothetical protein
MTMAATTEHKDGKGLTNWVQNYGKKILVPNPIFHSSQTFSPFANILHFCKPFRKDGQVRLVRLQTDDVRLFLL